MSQCFLFSSSTELPGLTKPLPNFILSPPPPLYPLPFPARRKSSPAVSTPAFNTKRKSSSSDDYSNFVSASSLYFTHRRRFTGTPRSSISSYSSLSTTQSSSASVKFARVMRRAPANIPPGVQAAFDSATSNLSITLDFPLVYLISIDLSSIAPLPALNVLSSVGLPLHFPSLSPLLHLEALRAAEGGVFYRATEGSKSQFIAGILVPVLEFGGVGYLLCGYSKNCERELGPRDVKYVMKFAEELECWIWKVGNEITCA
ncbi:hypothetical protein P7C70_g571, partial [Phenoliferia sp. Uapishka_3]